MGNHHVGHAMGNAAETVLKHRKSGVPALDLLDSICEPYRNCDAEFGANSNKFCDYTDPSGPLGILIAEAFSPNVQWPLRMAESHWERWNDGPYEKFRARYEFW